MEFQLAAKMTISVYTKVEAETLEEAIKIAEERQDYMSIISNNGDSEDDTWMVDELDGTPYDIHAE